MKIIRQGDIYFIEGSGKSMLPVKKDTTVALGEATGHHHTFSVGASVRYDERTPTLGRLVEVEAPTEITHQEHKAIPFEEPSTQRIIHQRRASKVGIHKVQD